MKKRSVKKVLIISGGLLFISGILLYAISTILSNHRMSLREQYLSFFNHVIPDLKAVDTNSFDNIFDVYIESKPEICISVNYAGVEKLPASIEGYKETDSNYLNTNRLLYGNLVYDDFFKVIDDFICKDVKYKMMIEISNPWARTLVISNKTDYWEILDSDHPLFVYVYILFSNENEIINLEKVNSEIVAHLSNCYDSIPVKIGIQSAYTSSYEKYENYDLKDAFSNKKTDFYNDIQVK